MKTQYEYLTFVRVQTTTKTERWSCRTVNGGVEIGRVSWYWAWRQYCYTTAQDSVYSMGCLNDIADFLKQINDKKRGKAETG